MAKFYLSLLFALATLTLLAKDSKIIEQSQGCITFVVDENLQPIDYRFVLQDGGKIAEDLLSSDRETTDGYRIVATSFADEHNMELSSFYQTLITAYA